MVLYLWTNLVYNMQRLRQPLGFGFLERSAGFRIAGADFGRGDTVLDALRIGAKNTLIVSVLGIVLATVLGVIVGIARLSTNWLVRRAAGLYVETIRNIPLLAIIIFWSTAVLLKLPQIRSPARVGDLVFLSNRGLFVPRVVGREGAATFVLVIAACVAVAVGVAVWRTRRFQATGEPHRRVLWSVATFAVLAAGAYLALGGPIGVSIPEHTGAGVRGGITIRPDFAAVLAGLVVYTASHIAEIVRGAIQAVSRGQTDAANALALRSTQRLRLVVLPQAFRIALPLLANQFLNLTKNSSLGIAVAYAELMTITQIVIANANPAPQSIAVLMAVYLTFSLTIAALTNLLSRRLERADR